MTPDDLAANLDVKDPSPLETLLAKVDHPAEEYVGWNEDELVAITPEEKRICEWLVGVYGLRLGYAIWLTGINR